MSKPKVTITNNIHNTKYTTKKSLGDEVSRDFCKKVALKLCPTKCCLTAEPFGQVGSQYAVKRIAGTPARYYLVDTHIIDQSIARPKQYTEPVDLEKRGYEKGYREGYDYGRQQGIVEGRQLLTKEQEAAIADALSAPPAERVRTTIAFILRSLSKLSDIDYTPANPIKSTPYAIALRLATQGVERLQKQYYDGELTLPKGEQRATR